MVIPRYEDPEYWKLKTSETTQERDSRHTIESALALLQDLKVLSVVDVGCGNGKQLFQLNQKLQASGLGIDISAAAITSAQATYPSPQLTFRQQDQNTLTETFDLCLCFDVFEHIEDYKTFLRQLRSKARHFLFYIPLDLSVRSVLLKSYLDTRTQYGHLHYFTAQSALAALRDCGYDVLKQRYVHGVGPLSSAFRSPKSLIGWLPFQALRCVSENLAVRIMGGSKLMVLARPQT